MSPRSASEARWISRPLRERDLGRALAFLRRSPLMNIYLLSRLLEDGLTGDPMIEVRRERATTAIALPGPNVAVAVDFDHPDTIEGSMEQVAEVILGRAVRVRAIIAPVEAVDHLWPRLAPHFEGPMVIRLWQPVYALSAEADRFPDLEFMRASRLSDLDQLVPVCAAMHVEEVGIDPLRRDASAYRNRIEELVRRNRSFIGVIERRIVFKCEVSASTPEAVQLMGVWTRPGERRRGFARKGLEEVCGHFLRQGKTVTLFVNDFNHAAIRLYESMEFRRIGANRAIIW